MATDSQAQAVSTNLEASSQPSQNQLCGNASIHGGPKLKSKSVNSLTSIVFFCQYHLDIYNEDFTFFGTVFEGFYFDTLLSLHLYYAKTFIPG